MTNPVALAERLNQECECIGSDVPALQQRVGAPFETHPHLFADVPVFLARQHMLEMQRVVSAVESVTKLPAFCARVLARAPRSAQHAPLCRSVFFGFDFHIGADGPKLIEINTNAGGAMLSVEMQRAQQACCAPVADSLRFAPTADSCEQAIFDMFMQEWRRERGDEPLRTVAIADDAPREQYLYPEFLLFKKLFETQGVKTLIVDARQLAIAAGALTCDGQRIDLVYNRTTDFYFTEPSHAALAEAYARNLAVVTPHPHAHALYSNKDNLVLLSDPDALRTLQADGRDIEVLERAVPRTLRVLPPEQHWWEDRKQWFFKPLSGYGGRGAYRGDKITRRAFGDVMRGNYIAQRIAPPSQRRRRGSTDSLKLDVRCYAYAGDLQLLAARLYQGQTTNFRSEGGGFAPVYPLDDDTWAASCSPAGV